jgi:hypothetical protein
MRKLTPVPMDAAAHAVYLTAAAINSLIQALPSGTAYCNWHRSDCDDDGAADAA